MRTVFFRFTVLLSLLLLSSSFAFAQGRARFHHFTLDEQDRRYWLYVPSTYSPETPAPLVIVLHGLGGTPRQTVNTSGMNAVAEEHGFLVAYPEAVDGEWHYGEGVEGYPEVAWDDVSFLEAVVADINSENPLDLTRVYATGISNGGLMTYRLACSSSDTFAAFAPVAATAPYGLNLFCGEHTHSPVVIIQGTEDSIMPWNGVVTQLRSTGQRIYATAPMSQTIGFWATMNECDIDNYTSELLPNTDADSHVQTLVFLDCATETGLMVYAIVGGGHTWPGIQDFHSDLLGEVNMDFNASEAIWAFFEQYSLPASTSE